MTNSQGVKVKYVPKPISNWAPQVNCLLGVEMAQVLVVCEYRDVFHDELLGIPPDLDIEFIIELMPGAGPIYKKPYRMAI